MSVVRFRPGPPVFKGNLSRLPFIFSASPPHHAAARDRLRSKFSELDVPDFETEPHRLAEPFCAAYSAADFADMENLNGMADSGDFDGYCDRINRGHKTRAEGDSNGYAERFTLLGGAREEFA